MKKRVGHYIASDEKEDLIIEDIRHLLKNTYWASERSPEQIEISVCNSQCFSIFDGRKLIAFARVVTDSSSVYWLCDVVVNPAYRGQGIGKMLLDFIFDDHTFFGLGILMTKDAHDLYERYGYAPNKENFMVRTV